jgi:signal transduction histidine kinase
MSRSRWFRSPGQLVTLFAAVMVVPAAALIWLGWKLVDADRALERQQQIDQLERRADRIVGRLQEELDRLEQELPAWLTAPPADFQGSGAVVVRLNRDGLMATSGSAILYGPHAAAAPDLNDALWSPGERLEMRRHDLAGAARLFQELAESKHDEIRAGAFIRLARVRRKQGRVDDAIAIYRRLAPVSVDVEGEPAALRARLALCGVLSDDGRSEELRHEAESLAGDLAHARWRIDRATYRFYADAIARWTAAPAVDTEGRVLADAIDATWRESFSSSSDGARKPGRHSLWIDGRPVLVVSRLDGDSVLAFAATSRYVEEHFSGIWRSERAALIATDADQHIVLGPPPPAGAPDVIRMGLEAHLPWTTIEVTNAEPPATLAANALRRRLLLGSLAIVTLGLFAGSGWFIVRAVQRELAVARLQGDFVSAVSHEFRTPLTSLTHLVANLRGPSPPSEDRRQQYYDVFARETDRLRRFVETLLDFGRVEAGAARYQLDPAEPGEVVEHLVQEFRDDASAGGRVISLVAARDLPRVRVDREALGRALWNLLDNAAKYSPQQTPIAVTVAAAGGRVLIRVADGGTGIPPAEQARIFRKFYRGASARASTVTGTGVGLALVHHIVVAHGGRIRLDSDVGRGSTFTIDLPADASSVSSAIEGGR